MVHLSQILTDRSLDLDRLLIHGESEVFRKQNSKVLANLEKRRDAEAKLMANEISPDEFLVAVSFQNSSQPFVLCALILEPGRHLTLLNTEEKKPPQSHNCLDHSKYETHPPKSMDKKAAVTKHLFLRQPTAGDCDARVGTRRESCRCRLAAMSFEFVSAHMQTYKY